MQYFAGISKVINDDTELGFTNVTSKSGDILGLVLVLDLDLDTGR